MKGEWLWCRWQVKCIEDVNPDEWTCSAHMCEGHAFRCPKRDMEHAKQVPGRCEDAEPGEVPAGCLVVSEERRR